MKNIVILVIAAAGFAACTNADKKAVDPKANFASKTGKDPVVTTDTTSIQWLDSTYVDLKQQTEGKSTEISFRFKNTGDKNLVIQNVSAQCGCTIPEKPEQPFAPGEEGVIKAKYNGSGHGEIRKEVYVTANTRPSTYTLTFRAEMVK